MAAKNLKVHKPYPRSACPHCEMSPRGMTIKDGENTCSACGKTFTARVFALPPEAIFVKSLKDAMVLGDEEQPAEDAAPCAKHEANSAVGNCERCGNFVCALCTTKLSGRDFCTTCFERLLDEGKAELRPAREIYYGGIASVLACCGILPPLGLVLGPPAIYYAVKGYRQARACKMPGNAMTSVLVSLAIGVFNTLICWGGLGVLIFTWVRMSQW